MTNDNSQNSKSLSTLTIQDVGVKIKITDGEAIKRWLKNKNIQIHKFPKGNYVYQVDVDCEIDKPFVKDLQRRFPNDWAQVYKKIAKDTAVYEMVVFSLSGEFIEKPMAKIKTRNAEEKALFKKYST